MKKYPVNSAWFDALSAGGTPNSYKWLVQINALSSIDSIANFGCCTAEPLILLWMFDADQIKVIEKDPENLAALEQDIEILGKRFGEALQGRSIELITPRDMSETVSELPSNYFDLAYCERVLYNMSPDLRRIRRAISEMARVVKPGGFVVSVDEKVDAKSASERNNLISIAPLFEAAGLLRIDLTNIPDWSYCYRKLSA